MRNVKMTVLIGESFDRMSEILFRPFSMKKWMRLLLISILAGMLFGSGGSGGGNNSQPSHTEPVIARAKDAKSADAKRTEEKASTSGTPQNPQAARRVVITVVSIAAVVIALLVFLIVFMTWVGARFKFVWLNAVINNTDAIIEPYSRHKREANSFFRLSLLLIVAFFAMLAYVIGLTIYGLAANGAFYRGFNWTAASALTIFLVPALSGVILLIIFFIFSFFADHFLVPIMAFEGCNVSDGLKKMWGIIGRNRRDFAMFTTIFLLLNIVAGTAAGILALFLLLIMMIVAAAIFGIPFLILWGVFKAKLIFTIYAIVAGIPFVITVLIAMLLTLLPLAVFFRAFSLKYLLSLDVGYGPDTITMYSSRKAERLSGRMPVIASIAVIFLLGSALILGLLASIAIPNFVRARQVALKKNAAMSRSVPAQTQNQKA